MPFLSECMRASLRRRQIPLIGILLTEILHGSKAAPFPPHMTGKIDRQGTAAVK